MSFFYPNWINDMWRVMGWLFFQDKTYFERPNERRFDQPLIEAFCQARGIALYDAARKVQRLKENASDKFLEVVEPTDLVALLEQLPHCRALVTTGEKATSVVSAQLGCLPPRVGESCEVIFSGRCLRFWRMPSTSRAYPLSLEKKAAQYHRMWQAEGVL